MIPEAASDRAVLRASAPRAILAALAVVNARRLLRAAIYLMGVLLASAGLYVMLGAEFLAGVQVLVYVGGIVVLIVFAIMLTRSADLLEDNPSLVRKLLGAVASIGFLLVTVAALWMLRVPAAARRAGTGRRAQGHRPPTAGLRRRRFRPAVRDHLAPAAGGGHRRHRRGPQDGAPRPAFHQRRRPAGRGPLHICPRGSGRSGPEEEAP